MHSVTVVTTLHKDGYDLYGQQHLETWVKFFPADWKIVYYAEDHTPILNEKVQVENFKNKCPKWTDFYSYILEQTKNVDEKKKNWYKKALRWSFKMYTVLDALRNPQTRYVIWLDADVKANYTPDTNWLNSCLKNTCLAAQLEHIKEGNHIETGIMIFDTQHPDIEKIKNWISLGYEDKNVLKERKAWDGIWMAKLLVSNTVSWNNLDMVIKQNTAQAFSNDKLKWLTHKVGDHKFNATKISSRSGRSSEQELI